MMSAQPPPITHQGLSHFLSYSNNNNNGSKISDNTNNSTSSNDHSPSPTLSATSTSSSAADSPISSPSSLPRTLSPERSFGGPELLRLCPNSLYPQTFDLGKWTGLNFKVLNEYIKSPDMTNPSTTLQLGPGESVLPLECSIIQGRTISGDEDDVDDDDYNDDDYNDGHENDSNSNNDGNASPCVGVSHLLQIESRGLQSASWFALESQAGPGIFESGNGGLEFRVTFKNGVAAPWRTAATATATTATTATTTNSRNVFWIRIGSPHSSIVSLAIGPYVVPSSIPPHKIWLKQRSRPRSQSPRSNEEATKVIRPFDITSHQTTGEPARILLITESHNYMPQGRVWDSAFVLLEFFKNRVAEGIRRRSSPILAGKKILDLSAGTGLLGLYLAGLAEVELQSSNSTASTPPTSVVMTDLDDAMDLIGHNISNNRMLALHVDISAQRLKWKTPFRAATNLKDLDVVIASDVIYDEKAFESLLSTLVGLCSPGRTEIYLGYKRRQLTRAKELEFFSKIKSLFHVEELKKEPVHELGVKIYRLSQG